MHTRILSRAHPHPTACLGVWLGADWSQRRKRLQLLTDTETINLASEAALAVVQEIPTMFGRLVYLAAMWDTSAGGYRCDPDAGTAGSEEVDAAMGDAHLDVFVRWLTLGLDRQRKDLMRFADSDGPGAYECILSWWTAGFSNRLAPATADYHETQLFLDDLELVIKSLVGDSRE